MILAKMLLVPQSFGGQTDSRQWWMRGFILAARPWRTSPPARAEKAAGCFSQMPV
jgi:hypothetical protein